MAGKFIEDTKPVLRFAPSPTGYLHIGGARTALFNYLLARHHGGRFLLRIEDTDRERSTEKSVAAIFEGLRWLGLDWDGEPVYQGLGIDKHRAAADRLLENGHAYRCFCTREELEQMREDARTRKLDYIYDGRYRDYDPQLAEKRAAAGEPHVIRFRVPEGETTFEDGVLGTITVQNRVVEDFIIFRSDSTPTYQLAVVADDIEMGITHIVRGDDHLSNTPKQIHIYQALEAPLPRFAHVPLILGPDKKRLSKRHGATSLTDYRDQGFLAETVVNFLSLLGWWPPQDDREIYSRDELIELFSVEGISRKAAVFDIQKLEWMNAQYISAQPAENLFGMVIDKYISDNLLESTPSGDEKNHLLAVIDLVKQRCRFVDDLVVQSRYFFDVELEYEEAALKKHWKEDTAALLEKYLAKLLALDSWDEQTLETSLRGLAETEEVGAGKIIHPVRILLTGCGVSPGLFEVMVLMGRELCSKRIRGGIDRLSI